MMICDCCRREVDYFRGSFWHGDTRICRECFAQWCDPNNDQLDSSDPVCVGNYVRLRHGLPPLAAALTIALLALTSTAQASRRCLDHAEAARAWPTRVLTKDVDGCWTYDHHPPRAEVPTWVPETIMPAREPSLIDRWPDTNLLEVELRELEPDPEPEATPPVTLRHLALFVWLVLATVSVLEVATGRPQSDARHRRWPVRRSTH
jgi:hypothetical protein